MGLQPVSRNASARGPDELEAAFDLTVPPLLLVRADDVIE
jgi:hypothetical protein